MKMVPGFASMRLLILLCALTQAGVSIANSPARKPPPPVVEAFIEFEPGTPNLSIWGRQTIGKTLAFASTSKAAIESISIDVILLGRNVRKDGGIYRPSTQALELGLQCQKTLQDLFAPYILELQLVHWSLQMSRGGEGAGGDYDIGCSAKLRARFVAGVPQCEEDKPCNIVCTSQDCRAQ